MTHADEAAGDWKQDWDAREAALTSVLGESDGAVLHALVPFHLGGTADVLSFRKHRAGRVAARCELLGDEGQLETGLGTYELMVAHRDETEWGPNLIAHLARYTCEARLEPGDTMEIGPAVPEGSTIAALLFCEYARFDYRGRNAGLLLCLGITADELGRCRAGGFDEVLAALKAKGVYPYTDLSRASVLGDSR